MNTTDTTTQQALNRCNHRFDHVQYHAIALMVADDLKIGRDSVRVADAMNLILCGIKDWFSRGWIELVQCFHHFS
jgi:hypothetical protein